MPITHRMQSGVVILELIEPVNDGDFNQLHRHAVDALDGFGGRLVVNLSRTSLVDHMELSNLRQVGVFYYHNGGRPTLAAPSPEARRVLDNEKFSNFFDIYDTEDKAIKSFA